jgi:hypothetical protein
MFSINNDKISVDISDDAIKIIVTDMIRNIKWQQDFSNSGYRLEDSGILMNFQTGKAYYDCDGIVVEYSTTNGIIKQYWQIDEDNVKVSLLEIDDSIRVVTLPGPMMPVSDTNELALPLYQGMLLRDSEGTWHKRAMSGGHGNFGMSMFGNLTADGALLVVQESLSNWIGNYGANDGKLYAFFEEMYCPVDGWCDSSVRLYPTESNVTAVCKKFRNYLIERGLFVSWEEKIAKKPSIVNLFGSLMAFTGYNRADDIDYAASVQRLRDYGFEKIFLFPVRMVQYSLDFKMGGDEPVWLSDSEIDKFKSIDGAMIGPWGWTFEGLDDGTPERHAIYRRNIDGSFMPFWKIDNYQWYQACPTEQKKHIIERFKGDLKMMDWIHFDVLATVPANVCYSLEHQEHGHRAMGKIEDTKKIQEIFTPETCGNRIVSSEGFVGHFTPYYDIGTTKIMPGEKMKRNTPVPMTMLVFHDSCIHDWWELQNYNALEGFSIQDFGDGFGLVGNGRPYLKAALDALYGCPPNLMPFGRQYGWVNIETRESFGFKVTIDDESVQEAMAIALPISQLHKEIGMLEMTGFDFLNDDRTLQTTLFANGTRIISNISSEPIESELYGVILPESWIKVEDYV